MTNPDEPNCTCPSGDGSLSWPCPAHPPASVEPNLCSEEISLTEAEAGSIVRRFERALIGYNQLFAEYQGKAMPPDVYERFTVMRDERLPAMRHELVALLVGKPC